MSQRDITLALASIQRPYGGGVTDDLPSHPVARQRDFFEHFIQDLEVGREEI